MEIDREVLEEAVARGEITPAQAASLYEAAARRRSAAAVRRPLAWRAAGATLTLAAAAAAWFAVQAAAPLLFGTDPGWAQRALLSSLCGAVLLTAGVAADRRATRALATWLYLPGLLALVGGTVTWTGASDLSLALAALVHAGLVAAALLLDRRAFAVAGALGLATATGRLADDLLDPAALSFALAGVALALVGLGLLFHLHEARLAAALQRRVPRPLRRLLPPAR